MARQSDVLQRLGTGAADLRRVHAASARATPTRSTSANNSVAALETLSRPVAGRVSRPSAHPRQTRELRTAAIGCWQLPGLRLIEPLGYLDFLALMDQARLVFTDSGGIQEETTVLGRPVPDVPRHDRAARLPSRKARTTWSVSIRSAPARRRTPFSRTSATKGGIPELWDGRAAERILEILTRPNCGRENAGRSRIWSLGLPSP